MGVVTVPAGPAGFLHVGLQGARDSAVTHQSYVRVVDPHAEGAGGTHDAQISGQEPLLHGAAGAGLEARVIVSGAHPQPAQGFGRVGGSRTGG